jgi:guanine deaminase
MRRAIALSIDNVRAGRGGPFGAVIARGGEVVAEATNRVTRANDPTAHAEVEAIRAACAKLASFHLGGCEIYTSCEPCPMCLGAIYWARLDRIWYANRRDDAARAGFSDDFLYRELALPPGERSIPAVQLLADEARAGIDEWLAKTDRIPY